MSAQQSHKFEYHFERRKIKTNFWGGKFHDEYQEVIRRFAAEGWRFVQAFAPATDGYGRSNYVELIFERPVE